MRISDWSSDVCSSDLGRRFPRRPADRRRNPRPPVPPQSGAGGQMSGFDIIEAMRKLGLEGALALEGNLQTISDLADFHYDDHQRLQAIRRGLQTYHHPLARSIVAKIDSHLSKYGDFESHDPDHAENSISSAIQASKAGQVSSEERRVGKECGRACRSRVTK